MKQFTTCVVLCVAMLFGTSMSAYAEDSLKVIKERGVIRIANTQSSPPWSYLGEDNNAAGYDVAIAKEVARRIGVSKVEFVADSFKNFVEGLKTDKYDVVMNDVTPTEERRKQVDFASPYGVEQFYIFVKENNDSIKSIRDMPGNSVGVTSGSSNETWARKHMMSSDIRAYENGGLLFNDLAIGRVDGVLSSLFGGEKFKKTNNLPIKAVGEPLTYQLSAPVVAKGKDSLRDAISSAIVSMVNDGTIDAYSAKWIGTDYHMTKGIDAALAELAEEN
ncbi:transporter substrate-binding domain-containing protein [Pseudomonas sp. SGAir0191]|uniref:transporter substrate-binding domain-containing protein n=1 Tax=Pseudomonas sp. SGAir0191 TaxID=2217867 RepID=UPI000C2C3E97|nr:transporter substrate-binding domain-containing protein [Pseudomonas sp. SGAir0191]AUA33300.1 transporter substrate-binding domain-containing protein [Pseudomonas sp. SGAir0191]